MVRNDAQLVLVVGDENSSNTKRLVEVANSMGVGAYRIGDRYGIKPEWFDGLTTVGLTAGASAPPHLVTGVIIHLKKLHQGVKFVNLEGIVENMQFGLPKL